MRYPKKLGEIEFNVDGNKVSGSVIRKGKKIIDVSFEGDETEFEQPNLFPRLQVKRMPHVEHDGTHLNTILKNEFYDAVTKKRVTGTASLDWEEFTDDPLALLGDVEVVGAVYIVGGYTLSYGTVIDDLQY